MKFKEWIINYSIEIDGKEEIIATAEELDAIDEEAKRTAKAGQKAAWDNYQTAIKELIQSIVPLVENLKGQNTEVEAALTHFNKLVSKAKKDVFHLARKALLATRGTNSSERNQLIQKYNEAAEIEKTTIHLTYIPNLNGRLKTLKKSSLFTQTVLKM